MVHRRRLQPRNHSQRPPEVDHVKLISKIRQRFRTNASATSPTVAQKFMKDAVKLNDMIVDSYENETSVQTLLSRISPVIRAAPQVSPAATPSPVPKKHRKNPDYLMLSEDEVAEFRQTKELPLPESTQLLLPSIHIHARWYFNTNDYPALKSKLDKRYMRTVFPSLIAHEKQIYYMKRLVSKLMRPPSHKMKRISGTGHWIYVINTPWNRDLRTQNFRFLGDTRKKYDELIIKIQECEHFRKRYEHIALQEAKWEKLLDKNTATSASIDDWTWLYTEAEAVLNAEKSHLENEVIQFCKRQGLIYEKIKPIFDEMHVHSKRNSELMQKEIEVMEMGPYTDVLDGGLGLLLKRYGFRDTIESKYSKIPKGN
ncbi:hypothetical protein PMKS-001514 [Pichia membranifaciens]|uniref:Uncharacterized protein n=1 Tax=Pichia membranifaciens TaxID=4926 RepID=A0A1Q2YER1_9ASCO|nr:hypothetical protein PMKS-001514 [Pichia membranifaciens]